MESAIIVSLNFNPGHVSHIVASYRQMEELGYRSVYCVADGFMNYLPKESRICVFGRDTLPKASIAIIVFPSHKNLLLIRNSKTLGAKIVYIFHEPLAPMKEYKKAGFSNKYLAKLWVINRISTLTVKWSDTILLPSKKAIDYYNANPLYKNENIHYLPLLYDDELTDGLEHTEKKFFSYIGTVAADHSFKEYLDFVQWAVTEERLSGLYFLIATKSEFEVPAVLADSSRVVILKGRPMSNAEINECYASSFVVWNAYSRTTQSGVLAKSFMFGTPAIILRKNLSEFTESGKEVEAIDDNTSFEEIEKALLRILNDYDRYSNNARNRFMESFYYRNHNDQMKAIIDSL